MSDGYRVNTDELEAVVSRLRALQQNMSHTSTKSKYNTTLRSDDFGGDFVEAKSLFTAHSNMQQFLSKTISDLDALINEFGDKTQAVNDAYKGQEYENKAAINRNQGTV